MAFIEANPIQATEKAGGKGTITIVHLLTQEELDGKCAMFSKVIIPANASATEDLVFTALIINK